MRDVIALMWTMSVIAIKLTLHQVPDKLMRCVAIKRLHAIKQNGTALTVLIDRRQSITTLNPSIVVFAHFASPICSTVILYFSQNLPHALSSERIIGLPNSIACCATANRISVVISCFVVHVSPFLFTYPTKIWFVIGLTPTFIYFAVILYHLRYS